MELTMNQLSIEKQIMIASLLVEGNSIRSIERITGTHRDTIMRLGITLGEKAQDILDKKMKNLNCKNIQADEIWCFVGKKKKNLNNFLRALPIELTMHNTGSIDSIANIIFLSANTRYTSVHSSFMFHGIFHPINASLKKIQLQELLSGINVSESKVAGIISERTNLTTKEIKRLFLQGETKDAPFALKKGLVTEIRDPKIPKDTEILSFNLP
jgi:hypothetical protein